MVHRLLAVAIAADASYPELLNKMKSEVNLCAAPLSLNCLSYNVYHILLADVNDKLSNEFRYLSTSSSSIAISSPTSSSTVSVSLFVLIVLSLKSVLCYSP